MRILQILKTKRAYTFLVFAHILDAHKKCYRACALFIVHRRLHTCIFR